MIRDKFRAAILILIGLGVPALAADDHIVEESFRIYRGNTSRKQIQETWIGTERMAYKVGSFLIITRYDLKKTWTIAPGKKLYFEEDLVTDETPAGPKAPIRIQELGWDYEPRYDFSARDTGEEQTINGIPCRKYIVEGQADFAEEIREIWIGSKVPIDLVRYDRKVLQADKTQVWIALAKAYPNLRPAIPMKTKIINEPSIAPTMIWNFELTKVETSPPPAGIYEIPAGFAKAASRDEIYRR